MNPVKRKLFDRGWTQKDLAERLGVKQSTITKWERDVSVYRKSTRKKLAKAFFLMKYELSAINWRVSA